MFSLTNKVKLSLLGIPSLILNPIWWLYMLISIIQTMVLTHLCPGKDYWADFHNFLHMNPSDDQMKKSHIFRSPTPSLASN